jgi:hypothetical protein
MGPGALRQCPRPCFMDCLPHLERVGVRVPATHMAEDVPMCAACFGGKPIDPSEEHGERRIPRACLAFGNKGNSETQARRARHPAR